MAPIRLVATDLDGTLLRSDRTISERTAAAMAALRAAGIELVWATARARHSVHEFALASGFRGKAICANGAVLMDLADGSPRVLRTVEIPADAAREALAWLRTLRPGVVFAAVGSSTFVAEPGYAELCVFTDHHREPATIQRSDDPVGGTDPIVKIVARHPEIAGVDLYRAAHATGFDGLGLTHSGAPYMELAPAGVTKASVLAALCADAGLDRADVAAIGDAINDAPMLAWAGTALCPAQAAPEVHAIAHRVLDANDEDGVAAYLEELAGSG
ncbi:MAG TPA: HAD family hydrolase [Aldersonia sp.]